ncbi:MAG: lysine--tRNA ligase [Candidatus Tritonobacter lacicola]|nr:lysine--tRNA ligase [Candidatus Tritonobacter lacicola]
MKLEDQIRQKKKRVEELLEMGVSLYGGRYLRRDRARSAHEDYREGRALRVAGRLTAYRRHGRTAFADISDCSGKLQIYVRRDVVGERPYELFKKCDVGDILGAEGELFRTNTGEITLKVNELKILAKALRPLPEKWHGLKDIETRFRKRYLDLISNPGVKETFVTRSRAISTIRAFLDGRGFLEVETPMMQERIGGAVAEPFRTHHNALDADLYLRIAPELFLKRLLVGGFEKIYELNRSFRNEGLSRFHNPEFTMLEVYWAYADYTDMMTLTEELIAHVAMEVCGGTGVTDGEGRRIDLSPPWRRLTFEDAVREAGGVKPGDKMDVREVAGCLDLDVSGCSSDEEVMNEILEKAASPKFIDPTFVTDYPVPLSPLARARDDNPSLCERFELFAGGEELANAYSELNDPIEQRKRFERQLRSGEKEGRELDDDFVTALEHGMPPAGGLGIGIDRLVMILTGKASIREVILFPQLRPESS